MKDISLLGFDARNIYLKASTPFHILWFKEHIQPKLYAFLKESQRKQVLVHFETREEKEKKSLSFKEKIEKDNFLNPLFTIDHFYFSKNNRLAHYAIDGEAKLLYIYGKKGVGKTHLLHALANEAKKKGKKIAIIDAKRFVWHFTTAIRTKQMPLFRSFYRDKEAIFLDNVEHFEGKSASQEELFHLFNAFHLLEKPMVFTSKGPPIALPLPNRMQSRFSMCLVVELQEILQSELFEFFQQKVKKLHLSIEKEALNLLTTFESSSKALLAFESLLIRSFSLNNAPISIEIVQQIIDEFTETKKLGSKEILQAVSTVFEIELTDLMSKSKKFAKQRAMAMFFCRHRLHLSFAAIGKIFDKDHSTVMSAIKKCGQGEEITFGQVEKILNTY